MVRGLVSCATVMSHYLHKLGSGTVVCTSGLELLMRQQGGESILRYRLMCQHRNQSQRMFEAWGWCRG